MNTSGINYKIIYSLLNKPTPLPADCGRVCGAACCREGFSPAEDCGMLLFPGEEKELPNEGFELRFHNRSDASNDGAGSQEQGILVLCGGKCDRARRPLACRVFPLFPYLSKDGRIRAVYDPRAFRLCPLVREQARVPLERSFVRTVRYAGRLIAGNERGREFLEQQSKEIDEFNRFLQLDRRRSPICRKSPVI